MSRRNLVIALSFVLLFAQSLLSQTFMRGMVTDVLDGRTLVVETEPEKTVKVRLRYIEVPEKEQPLSDVVKSHLTQLATGKSVEIRDIRLVDSYIVGVVVTKTSDLNQQMLRDGAGWFDIAENNSVKAETINLYRQTEAAAKSEKRGVWGINGLQPAWEFRNDKEFGNPKFNAVARSDRSTTTNKEVGLAESVTNSSASNKSAGAENMLIYSFQAQKETGAQPASFAAATNGSANLNNVFYSRYNKGSTSTNALEFSFQNGKTTQKLAMWFGYNYSLENSQKKISSLGLVVVAEFLGKSFLKGRNISLSLDEGKVVNLGQPKYFSYPKLDAFVFENIDPNSLANVLSSQTVTVVIGKYKKVVPGEYKSSIDSFINAIQ